MGIYDNALAGASGNQVTGYNLTKSLRFRASASAYLNRTPASAGNRSTWTYSTWIKRGKLGADQGVISTYTGTASINTQCAFTSNDTLDFYDYDGSGFSFRLVTTQVFRDPSAWYHIVLVLDTTQATSSNRVKMYVNGVQITSFSTATYPSLNYALADWNNNSPQRISEVNGAYFDGYLAETNNIDGQGLTPSSFGENNATTGVWQPKKYTGTYGTNGFYLPFTNTASTSTLGNDFSGNGNTWTVNNVSLTAGATYDSMTDVPTLTSATVANYCVINPLDKGTNATVDNGNLRVYSSSGWTSNRGTMTYPSTGKYYFEWVYTSNNPAAMVGIATYQANKNAQLGSDAFGWGYHYSGDKYNNNTATAYGASYTTGDVIGVALDMTAGTLTFYKNNTSQGTAFSGLTGVYFPVSAVAGATAAEGPTINFGQQPFVYTPPTGYKALNTYNLPDSTIVAGNKVMDATTYSGTSATQNIVNAGGFKPDLVWTKSRTNPASGYLNILSDSVRGQTSGYYNNLYSDANYSENVSGGVLPAVQGGITTLNSNGFTLASGSGLSYWQNESGYNYVGWQWQAGQGTNTTNTSGTITSTVSVNASAGFSVVTYTGTGTNQTVGHGLGVAPAMIIAKSRNSTANWITYHQSTGKDAYMNLNTTNASASLSNYWGTSVNSSTFGFLSNAYDNGNGNMVAYCWSEIAGFSQFGKYTGNGSTDGPFVYTGFRPKFVLIKCTNLAGSFWVLQDTTRNPYNVMNSVLYPNSNSAEATTTNIDALSNGFKLRTINSDYNNSGSDTYIYMAFAENPFKNALAR
jgi:hypothetical protein